MNMNWKEYQKVVGDVFIKLGCDVKINKSIRGARGKHDIDVYVTFEIHGIECVWIIECKYWKESIPKEKVLVLQKIVEDVGADRGLLVSEAGFQSGAINSSNNTNITLSSLNELKKISKNELFTKLLNNMNDRIIVLQDELVSLTRSRKIGNGNWTTTEIIKVNPPEFYSNFTLLSILESVIKDIKRNKSRKRYPVRFSKDREKLIFANNLNVFLEKASEEIKIIEKWYKKSQKIINKKDS